MVENIIVENGTTWEKELIFEDLSFLSSKSSCGCTVFAILFVNFPYETAFSERLNKFGTRPLVTPAIAI